MTKIKLRSSLFKNINIMCLFTGSFNCHPMVIVNWPNQIYLIYTFISVKIDFIKPFQPHILYTRSICI